MGAAGGEEIMQGPSGRGEKINVSVRLRPLNEKEISRNDLSEWECINDSTIIYRSNLSVSERSMYPTAYTFGKEVLKVHFGVIWFTLVNASSGSYSSNCVHFDIQLMQPSYFCC